MWLVTIKGLWAHKLRLVSTAVAIILGVGFMAGTYVFTDTIGRTFDDLFSSAYSGTDTVVRSVQTVEGDGPGSDERRPPLEASLLDEVRALPEVERAEGYVRGYAQLVKRSNKPLGGRSAPTFGFGWIDDERLIPFRIVDGRAPTGPDEIAIDKASARIGEFAVGDTVKVLSTSPTQSFTVVGIMRFGTADSPAGASAVAFTPERASQLFQTDGKFDAIRIAGKPGLGEVAVTEAVSKAIGNDDREVLSGTEITKITQSNLRDRLNGFTVFLTAFAYLALFVGMFVISNTFSILVAQRTREVALLRTLGASRRQIVSSVLLEAGVVAIISSLAGMVAGMGLAWALRALFTAVGFTLPGGGLVVLARTVIASLIAGVGITVISAVIPAWRASTVPPLAAMRDVAVDRSASSRVRLIIGLVMAAGVAALTAKGLSGNGSPLTVGAAFAAGIITVTVLGPTISGPVGQAIGAVIARWRGTTGALAQRNAVRNPKRTARTAMALTIGISVVAMVLTFTSSFKGLVSRTIDGQFSADYIITGRSFTGFSPEVARKVSEVPGVEAVTGIRFGSLEVNGEKEFAAAFDTEAIGRLVDLPVVAGAISDVGEGEIALSDEVTSKRSLELGDEVDVLMPLGPTKLRIGAILDDTKIRSILQGGAVIISIDTYDAGFTEQLDFQVYAKVSKTSDLDAVSTAIESALVDYPSAQVLDQAEYKRSISDQVNQFVYVVFFLLFLSVLIALFGVANTLLLSIHERTRELGLLRAVGMTRAQVRAAVRWESVIMALIGVLLGMSLGVGFGVLIMRSLRDDGFTEVVVPWTALAVITLIGIAFGVMAGIRPARSAAKLDVLSAISSE
ncbi:MAG: ABC transporter permease [Acidimicrobiia bacterium]